MFENVNHPIKDGIIADNSTLSSRKIKEMVENATKLPTPAAVDKNKVISVNNSGEYVLTTPFSVSLLPGMIQNGATLSPINLPKAAGSFNANEIILALVDMGNSNTSIYFRKSYETSGSSGITTFSAITYESSKVYYHELKVGYKSTSIPAGTTVSKIEIG